MQSGPTPTRLLNMQLCLMLLFVCWQITFFSIHYQVSDLIDSLTHTSIAKGFIHSKILLPLAAHILIQLSVYALITYYVYIVTIALGYRFNLRPRTTYWFGLTLLMLAIMDLLALNSQFFPSSFFAWPDNYTVFLYISTAFWLAASLIAFGRVFWILASLLILNGLCLLPPIKPSIAHRTEPNVIFIGLDSLRPDFTGFYGHPTINTPTIDQFLNHSVAFDHAYTPLARTFPAWVSVLTAQHPKHHGARNNLADISFTARDTLAKKLQQHGYFTIYATDEKRFSNITTAYGFDKLAGPSMGVNDFIIGGLSDFPVTNLLTKLPIAKVILPYNYANRAATVTYDPNHFLGQVNDAIAKRPDKPLFLAIHLCLSHWPYTWANTADMDQPQIQKYKLSVEAIDNQLKKLLAILKQNGLLDNSIVVLLSDHGTALGIPHDTLLDKHKYRGNSLLLKNIPVNKLAGTPEYSADFKHDYSTNTAYGQGTNVASLKQYRTLLAFQYFGNNSFKPHRVDTTASLTDIAPTMLSLLNTAPLKKTDGVSLLPFLKMNKLPHFSRSLFLETGDRLTEIETDHIYLEKVVAKKIGIYHVDPITGLLTMDRIAEKSIIANKQRAIIAGDWLLAHYPTATHEKLVPKSTSKGQDLVLKTFTTPAYYVLVNLKSGQWTIGLDTPFAKTAPVVSLKKKLHDFYGDEIA